MTEESLKAFEDMTSHTFLHIIYNWATIRQNSQLMNILDMQANTMCRYFKQLNPLVIDSFIQARVLTFVLLIFCIISLPTYNILYGMSLSASVPNINQISNINTTEYSAQNSYAASASASASAPTATSAYYYEATTNNLPTGVLSPIIGVDHVTGVSIGIGIGTARVALPPINSIDTLD
jgi:hypothetical protein